MSRAFKLMIGILVVLVALAIAALPGLRQAIARLGGSPRSEEQSRREVMQLPISTPTDVKVKAQLYWLSPGSSSSLEPTTVELPLSADTVERSKQLLDALIADAPTEDSRTLPADATLLAFYLEPDGTAIADFSDELSLKTPSGILSEQAAIDSITDTLGANVEAIQRLKILVHGQEADTLAGHIDLSGFFPVAPPPAPAAAPTAEPATPAAGAQSPPTAPAPASPAPSTAPLQPPSPVTGKAPTKPAPPPHAPPAPTGQPSH